MKKILGISAFYHDSAAVLLVDGVIVAAAQEERFTRKKNTPDFPENAVKYCLQQGACTINDLDAVVFYDKPFLKFERLLETYYAFAPKGLLSFLKAIPVWVKEKLFLKKMLLDGLAEIEPINKKKIKLLFPEHHLSHAASAFFSSPYTEASILTIDGVGEWATATICRGKDNKITLIKEMRFPHSVGLLYSAFTYFLGFKVNSGEYKLMGLAPYGNPGSQQTLNYIRIIKEKLVSVKEDGSVWLNQEYFNYATGLKMIHEKKWEALFGFNTVRPGEELEQKHCDLAYAIQHVTEEIVLKMAKEAKRITGSENLCMAGGVALNCVANGKLLQENIFKNIFIQPAAGDAGGALGAALAVNYLYFDETRSANNKTDGMRGSYLGPEYSDKEISAALKNYKAVFTQFGDYDLLCKEAADLLDKGNVIGWFQGRMEFGPRALGNRSILGDPRNKEMQKKMNLKIKYREGFRPFAPAVIEEDAENYFDLSVASPYMLFVADVKKEKRKNLASGFQEMSMWDKLYQERSEIPAVTHVDFSARIQTVHKETNPKFHKLLNAFKEKTACGVLVNSSFNVRGEPMVCSPEDAYKCFMSTEMDHLVIGNFLLVKVQQPDHTNREKWKTEFAHD
jgi:carbamoyltransferase